MLQPLAASRCVETGVIRQTIIDAMFILSAVGIALVDDISNASIEEARRSAETLSGSSPTQTSWQIPEPVEKGMRARQRIVKKLSWFSQP